MKKNSISSIFDHYKKRFTYFDDFEIDSIPDVDLRYIIVIPCFAEPNLLVTLKSLLDCESPTSKFEVIVVVNQSESPATEVENQNLKTINEFKDWIVSLNNPHLDFQLIDALNLNQKKAGVGLARKIGMDMALQRFSVMERTGHIICLDADCTVSSNYLVEIEKQFNIDIRGGHLAFEHKFEEVDDPELKNGIIQYELHLRYHNSGLRYSGFPFAKHTIGSCMVVRSDVYAKMGGMNQRKAGEDFYFMHKIYPGGKIVEVQNAFVFPSARISDRVPFGTGRFQGNWINGDSIELATYHPETYVILKLFFESLFSDRIKTEIPKFLLEYLSSVDFFKKIEDTKRRSSNKESFIKNVFHWLDGFFVLKMVHYLRDSYLGEMEISKAANILKNNIDVDEKAELNLEQLLLLYRKIENGIS